MTTGKQIYELIKVPINSIDSGTYLVSSEETTDTSYKNKLSDWSCSFGSVSVVSSPPVSPIVLSNKVYYPVVGGSIYCNSLQDWDVINPGAVLTIPLPSNDDYVSTVIDKYATLLGNFLIMETRPVSLIPYPGIDGASYVNSSFSFSSPSKGLEESSIFYLRGDELLINNQDLVISTEGAEYNSSFNVRDGIDTNFTGNVGIDGTMTLSAFTPTGDSLYLTGTAPLDQSILATYNNVLTVKGQGNTFDGETSFSGRTKLESGMSYPDGLLLTKEVSCSSVPNTEPNVVYIASPGPSYATALMANGDIDVGPNAVYVGQNVETINNITISYTLAVQGTLSVGTGGTLVSVGAVMGEVNISPGSLTVPGPWAIFQELATSNLAFDNDLETLSSIDCGYYLCESIQADAVGDITVNVANSLRTSEFFFNKTGVPDYKTLDSASAYLAADLSFETDLVRMPINFYTVSYNPQGSYEPLNARFTAPRLGYYLATVRVLWNSKDYDWQPGDEMWLGFYVSLDGAPLQAYLTNVDTFSDRAAKGTTRTQTATTVLRLDTGDYFQPTISLQLATPNPSRLGTLEAGSQNSALNVVRLA